MAAKNHRRAEASRFAKRPRSGLCLYRRIREREHLVREIAAWQQQRNAAGARVDWMFTTERARTKLAAHIPNPSKSHNHCAEALARHAGLTRGSVDASPAARPAAVKKESSLGAFADALSLALCGYLKAPMTLEAPAQNGDLIRIEFTDRP